MLGPGHGPHGEGHGTEVELEARPCAINWPSAMNNAVEKSSASLTTNERAVR